jgi:signal transduction histidine kinase
LLDREYLASVFFPYLVNLYFGGLDKNAYFIRILDASHAVDTVYSSYAGGNQEPFSDNPEIRVKLFRMNWLASVARAGLPASGRELASWPESMGREDGAVGSILQTSTVSIPTAGNQSGWILEIHHRDSAAEEVVFIQNLFISFGILILLGSSLLLLLVAARRARRLAEREKEFIAAVSHELHTPLSVIFSAGENLFAGIIDEDRRVREYGGLIKEESQKLHAMLDSILLLAGIRADAFAMAKEPVHMGELVQSVLDKMGSQFAAFEIEVETDIDGRIDPVMGNREALFSAVHNLVFNAVKHGKKGRWIKVTLKQAANAGLQIEIQDHGDGIDPGDLRHVFEPFYRGRKAVRDQTPGSGFGLNLVKNIVESHGGRIAVESRNGHGTLFRVSLPINRSGI